MANGFFSATGDIMKGLADAAARKRDELVSSAETRLKIERLKSEVRTLRQEKDGLLISRYDFSRVRGLRIFSSVNYFNLSFFITRSAVSITRSISASV